MSVPACFLYDTAAWHTPSEEVITPIFSKNPTAVSHLFPTETRLTFPNALTAEAVGARDPRAGASARARSLSGPGPSLAAGRPGAQRRVLLRRGSQSND